MQQIKKILGKELDAVLPATNQMSNYFFESCLKSSNDETGYARCMMRRLEHLYSKQDELSQKFQFIKLKFQQCKKSNIKHVQCLELVKKLGTRSIDQFIKDIQKY